MESGDIIYFLLLIGFMVLGFFNDSRKRKKKEEELRKKGSGPLPGDYPEEPYGYPGDYHDSSGRHYGYPEGHHLPPEPPTAPSMGELQPSLSSPDYMRYGSEATIGYDSPEIPVESRSRRTSDGKNRGSIHPLVAELYGENATNELRKGIIYSELLNRRY